MELTYDPDRELSDEEFREYFPDSGDLAMYQFSDDETASRYARLYSRCVGDDETGECVFCHRWDH